MSSSGYWRLLIPYFVSPPGSRGSNEYPPSCASTIGIARSNEAMRLPPEERAEDGRAECHIEADDQLPEELELSREMVSNVRAHDSQVFLQLGKACVDPVTKLLLRFERGEALFHRGRIMDVVTSLRARGASAPSGDRGGRGPRRPVL